MLRSNIPDLDLSRLEEMVEKELKKLKEQEIPVDLSVNDPYSWNNIGEMLETAKLNVNAGAERYAAGYYRGWKKIAAKLLVKISYILGRSISIPQRRFNNALLHIQHIMLNGLREMNSEIKELKARHTYQLAEHAALLNYLRVSVSNQERRITHLLEELEQQMTLNDTINVKALAAADDTDFLDSAYLAFEDRFRGTREEIRDRLKFYLPKLKEANAGTVDNPIVDLGCGRGEWLELLADEHLIATGIDLNSAQIQECRNRGLQAEEQEAISFLKGLDSNSLGAITSFHLIEHLDFSTRIALFDECIRVLKPGGFAIFETPNPKNLLVGSCDFWSDPTHARPLFPESHKLFMEQRGFYHVDLLFLHPHDEEQRLPEDEAPLLAKRLNDLYSCARDYALIGYKA